MSIYTGNCICDAYGMCPQGCVHCSECSGDERSASADQGQEINRVWEVDCTDPEIAVDRPATEDEALFLKHARAEIDAAEQAAEDERKRREDAIIRLRTAARRSHIAKDVLILLGLAEG